MDPSKLNLPEEFRTTGEIKTLNFLSPRLIEALSTLKVLLFRGLDKMGLFRIAFLSRNFGRRVHIFEPS